MKRFWAGNGDTVGSMVGGAGVFHQNVTSFSHAKNFPGRFSSHVRKAHSFAGGTPDQRRCTTGGGHCVPDYAGGTTRIASDIPGYLGGFPGITGGSTGGTGGVPDLAMSPHSATECASGVAGWVSRRTGSVSGATGGVSSMDRCMKYRHLCGFYGFSAFPFSAVKPNTEKHKKRQNK